jgi:hypothetical protein
MILSVPVGNRGNSLFLWACLQTNLWVEMPADSLATLGQMTVILHNTLPGQNYLIGTKQSLGDPQWSVEQTVPGAAGSAATTVQLATSNRPTLFVRAQIQQPAIPDFALDLTPYYFDGPTFIPVDFKGVMDQVDSLEVLIDGVPFQYAEFTSFEYGGQTNWGMGIYFDRLPSGDYQIQLQSTLRQDTGLVDNASYQVVSGAVQTITVDNQVTFTNWDDIVWNNVSYTFQAQTKNQNTDWSIDVYDAWGYWVNGGSGHTMDGNISWTWDLRDYEGYLRNNIDYDPFFDPWITFNESQGGGGLAAAQTQRPMPLVSIAYPDVGTWLVSYLNLFYQEGTSEYDWMVQCMQAIAGWIDYRDVPVIIQPIAYGTNDYTQAERDGDWHTTLAQLSHPDFRNFYYFGHGNPEVIGGDTDQYSNNVVVGSMFMPNSKAYLNSKTVKDKATQNKSTGYHPFRFVWLDACNTARGGWPDAFGVNNATNNIGYYNSNHKRPSAFVGWNTVVGGQGWGRVDYFFFYRSQWMQEWSYNWMTESLLQALADARRDSNWPQGGDGQLWGSLKVYGFIQLRMDQYNHKADWP